MRNPRLTRTHCSVEEVSVCVGMFKPSVPGSEAESCCMFNFTQNGFDMVPLLVSAVLHRKLIPHCFDSFSTYYTFFDLVDLFGIPHLWFRWVIIPFLYINSFHIVIFTISWFLLSIPLCLEIIWEMHKTWFYLNTKNLLSWHSDQRKINMEPPLGGQRGHCQCSLETNWKKSLTNSLFIRRNSETYVIQFEET